VRTDQDPIGLLLEQHVAFYDLFARHQVALLDRRLIDAARLLEDYDDQLRQHIAFQESHLLPQRSRAPAARWPVRVYLAEHRRIVQLLTSLRERLERERRRGMTSTSLISLLDEERALKYLVEHHHAREERALFCELKRVLPSEIGNLIGCSRAS
jgi:DUF438 domain-containing protein